MRGKVIIFFVEMKIVIYSCSQLVHTKHELRALIDAVLVNGFAYALNNDFADIVEELLDIKIDISCRYDEFREVYSVDAIMVSYGGDGTFLEAVRMLRGGHTPILGINSGRLGFLANVPKSGIEMAFEELAKGEYSVSSRPTIEVDGELAKTIKFPFAFNEFSVQRKTASMISVETYIDGEMVANYWGDGVLLSTPSGSTAYSLSVGGPIIAPNCECFVLAPISPHNLTMRPIIIPDSSQVEFRAMSRDGVLAVTIDNQSFEVENNTVFTLKKSNSFINLIKLQNISFYDTLRNKMMWGIDPRDYQK